MPRVIKCDKCQNNFLQQWVIAKKHWSQINQVSYWTGKKWNNYQFFCRSCLNDWFEKDQAVFNKLVNPQKKKLFLGYRSSGLFSKKDLTTYQPLELPQAEKPSNKTCLECSKTLNFLAVKSDGYLCGQNKCLRGYIEKELN